MRSDNILYNFGATCFILAVRKTEDLRLIIHHRGMGNKGGRDRTNEDGEHQMREGTKKSEAEA